MIDLDFVDEFNLNLINHHIIINDIAMVSFDALEAILFILTAPLSLGNNMWFESSTSICLKKQYIGVSFK
jgi:hypothetical protein